METTTRDEDERTLLRGVGLRVTRPRLAVLTALADHPHADASTVLAAVRRALPGTSHQAVYDCLHALTEAGLVARTDDDRYTLTPLGADLRRALAPLGRWAQRWDDAVGTTGDPSAGA